MVQMAPSLANASLRPAGESDGSPLSPGASTGPISVPSRRTHSSRSGRRVVSRACRRGQAAETRAPPRPAAEQAPSLQLGPDRVGRTGGTRPARPPVVEPLAPCRYKVQFTASAEFQQKPPRLQALTPGADLAQVVEQAITERLERLEAKRFARVKNARKRVEDAETRPSSSRYIPAPIRRAVYERDGGRCTYIDAAGRRCTARRRPPSRASLRTRSRPLAR